MIERIDEFIFKIVETCLDWLNEWLSITQKQVLSGMIVVYGVTWVVSLAMESARWTLAFIIFVAIVDWMCRNVTNIEKMRLREALHQKLMRISMVILLVLVIVISDFHKFDEAIYNLGATAFVLTSYVKSSFIDSERGGKRKMALAKLKELFGSMNWIPEPEMGQ